MARRRTRSVDASDVTSELDSLLAVPGPTALVPLSPFDVSLDDNRTFHPDGVFRTPSMLNPYEPEIDVYERPIKSPSPRVGGMRGQTRPFGRTAENRQGLSQKVAFRNGDRVSVCVRRKQRKEVLHALRKTGRGSGRPRRYNRYSQVRC